MPEQVVRLFASASPPTEQVPCEMVGEVARLRSLVAQLSGQAHVRCARIRAASWVTTSRCSSTPMSGGQHHRFSTNV